MYLTLQDVVAPVLENFPDDVTTTCSPEGGGPAALAPVANVTAVDPNDASFHLNTTFSEQQVSRGSQQPASSIVKPSKGLLLCVFTSSNRMTRTTRVRLTSAGKVPDS
jgi:hypothetical protein